MLGVGRKAETLLRKKVIFAKSKEVKTAWPNSGKSGTIF
jgi:hypothetical protein